MARLNARGLTTARIGPLELALAIGECIGLAGPSGSGKTQLLRALADLDARQGALALDGVPADDVEPTEWRRRVGLLPAEPVWWAETVGAHFPLDTDPPLAALGLNRAILQRAPSTCSTGERQRLALARLLARDPQVLLLDEPTANLDAASAGRVVECIRERRDTGVAVLWVAHDEAELGRVADRRLTLVDGRVETGEAAWS
ncbi:ABC transporter [Thiohalospira halophila DSM 15071]|uniref:ABC transporter n=1 Tax=Thiohalospira halophila DSM 15071 TaxID=1123397 RepID=A0A1I1W0K3_9GAMM|nr:ATP-binding cassette domain-containing protein [Thiohalospira halophila]SFD88641.1 ABC transporter [Thiohalospira halophila DSM 15071]